MFSKERKAFHKLFLPTNTILLIRIFLTFQVREFSFSVITFVLIFSCFEKLKKLPGENGEGKFLDFAQQLICYKSFLFMKKLVPFFL